MTAECSMLAVDLAQLYIRDDAELSCLLNLSHIGALAINRLMQHQAKLAYISMSDFAVLGEVWW